VNDLVVKTNMSYNVPLNSNTLLADVDEQGRITIQEVDTILNYDAPIGEKHIDHLFLYEGKESEEPFAQILDRSAKTGIEVRAISKKEEGFENIPLKFFQMYTPPSRKCLAIEPMTSPGNAFNIDFPNLVYHLEAGKKAKKGQFDVSILKLSESNEL